MAAPSAYTGRVRVSCRLLQYFSFTHDEEEHGRANDLTDRRRSMVLDLRPDLRANFSVDHVERVESGMRETCVKERCGKEA